MYCDVKFRDSGFNGEEIRSGSVLVVKTHKASFNWTDVTVPIHKGARTLNLWSQKVPILLGCTELWSYSSAAA